MLVNCCSATRSVSMLRSCDSCRSAPGAVYCHADAAVLCTACDADVHAANLISHRHFRVPVIGIPDESEHVNDDEDGNQGNYAALFGEDSVDEYLDLREFSSGAEQETKLAVLSFERVKSEVSEGVVPVQSLEEKKDHEVEFGHPAAALSHGVLLSSMETHSIVPDTTATEVSNPRVRASKGTMELFCGPPIHVPTEFSPMDREARVLRYREKKKNRKFEKTIRYASRKAYAEARPRIKGRFAKRSEVEMEVDQMFSNYVVPEDGYDVVPSFQNL